ncbi:MAG TPA: transposase [Oculatellaceae cyanobacterium]|jgi:hypothetical protein
MVTPRREGVSTVAFIDNYCQHYYSLFIVSVNAYGVVEGITYPLIFEIFKPKNRLKPGEQYKTKPQIAVEIIKELNQWGFKIKLVLADSLYGESGDVIDCLDNLKLLFIVAIRSNHGVLMPPGSRKRYNRWKAYQQKLSGRRAETRYLREIIFGKRRALRYYQISKTNTPDPTGDESWYIMTNVSMDLSENLAQLYSLRNWIEYGFKQVKNELGWADFRLTNYQSIERWWEIIFSAYLLVSIHATYFRFNHPSTTIFTSELSWSSDFQVGQHSQHSHWESGTTWKSALNNLRLIIQPYIFYCLIQPWLTVFSIPGMKRCFLKLIDFMNNFRASPLSFPFAS